MSQFKTVFGLVLVTWLLGTNPAVSQQATEVFIPIGASPGISDTESIQGTISHVNYSPPSIEVSGRDGSTAVSMSGKTLYYLDRSKYGRANAIGNMQDCEVGLTVEVKLAADGTAEWIKIETG